MKTKHLTSTLIAIGLSFFAVVSCSNSDDDANSPTTSPTEVQNILQNGTWKITRLIDSAEDETSQFTGYNFTFQNSGVLTASNGNTNYSGTWSILTSSSDDDSLDDLELFINFNLTNDFEDLNDEWDFISKSSTKIELIDISGGNGGTDYLTFERN